MNKPRYLYAALACALLLVAGSASAGSHVTVDATSGTLPAPLVSIVVYDGTQVPAKVVAGCSEPDCMGWTGPITGTVTHVKNNVGWSVSDGDPRSRIYLYVDGQFATSARPGRLMVWSTSGLARGPHTLEAMSYNSEGTEGWSTPLTIDVAN